MYKKDFLITNVTAFEAKSHSYSCNGDGAPILVLNQKKRSCSFSVNKIVSKGNLTYCWIDQITSCDVYQNFSFLKRINNSYLLRHDDNYLIDKSFINLKKYETFYNLVDPLSENVILKKYVLDNLYVHENAFIAYNNPLSYIKLINSDNETKWQLSLSDLGEVAYEDKADEVERILGVAYGNIWFNTKGGRLIVLNSANGQIITRFSFYKEDEGLGYIINEGFGDIYLNKTDENLYALGGTFFTKIDTKTCKVEERVKYKEIDTTGMGRYKRIYSPLLQGDYFTFLAQKNDDYGGIRFVGIFNYRKKELVWEYEVISPEEKKAGNELVRSQPLYMSDDKLYIKDFRNTLHIFQREV